LVILPLRYLHPAAETEKNLQCGANMIK